MAKRIHIVAQENKRGSVNVLNEGSVISSSRWTVKVNTIPTTLFLQHCPCTQHDIGSAQLSC